MSRQDARRPREKEWDFVHYKITSFFRGFIGYINTTGNQPTPGAEAFAYAKQMLPLQEWKGPGEVVLKQAFLTAPQVYVAQTVVPTGIAGIGAGQIWNGQLLDNPNNNAEIV
jgi:hypothetical protein